MFDLVQVLGGLLALAGVVLGFGYAKKKQGQKEARDAAAEEDQDRAQAIRDRVRNPDDSLRDYDDAGYRD